MNVSTILDMAAESCGERIGVLAGGTGYSYAQLRALAQQAARRFSASGMAHVALLDVNSAAAPVALFGAAWANLPYAPVNYRLTRPEINALLARLAPVIVVAGPGQRAQIDAGPAVQVVDRETLLRPPAAAADPLPPPEADPRAVAVQLFTSGTTGAPKAAILRHENLMAYIMGTVEFCAAGEDDTQLVAVPPYHIAGISTLLSATWACRRIALLENFEPAAWLALARSARITNAFLVPTMLQRIVEHLQAGNEAPALPALRALAYGGGKMPLATIRAAMQLLPEVDFTNAYGLTETSSTVAVLGPEDHRAAFASTDPAIRRRLASVGRAAAVEIEIRDEAGAVLGPEQAGLVFVRGPQVAGEYAPQAGQALGSQLDADGWFPTKDRGWLDADGYLFLDGRADDVIVRGGENISPGEIEEVLLSHPAVADAACVAVPDPQWGEAVAAAVVLRAGAAVDAAELQARVRGQLRSSRVPQRIVFCEALPYNETGKVLRRVLRQQFAEPGA